jgi:hypothetical protein
LTKGPYREKTGAFVGKSHHFLHFLMLGAKPKMNGSGRRIAAISMFFQLDESSD